MEDFDRKPHVTLKTPEKAAIFHNNKLLSSLKTIKY
jgi:hypothetical protein